MSDDLYMSADEAASRLGVTVGTLYSYVSRKGLRSFPVPGSRRRRYWRADIESLLPDATELAAPARLAQTTALTLLTEAGLFYRGRDAVALAETETVETVAALLWGADPSVFDLQIDRAPAMLPDLLRLLGNLPSAEVAIAALTAIEHENPRSADLSAAGFARTSASVLRWFASIVAGEEAPSDRPIHLTVARLRDPSGRLDDLVRRALVLAADHELDPTAYVVRGAGNVGCTPYGAALAGLVASRGQRLRHQRTLATERFVREIVASAEPEREVGRLFRLGEVLPGFTPLREHIRADPRAVAMLGAMRDQLADQHDFLRLDRAITAAAEITGVAPHFILPVTFLGLRLGYAGEPLTFSAPGRLVGWLAQALEQYQGGEMIRPRAAYVGQLP